MEFKPRPYTKREFLSKLQKPYVNPDTKEEVLPKQAPPSLPLKPGQPEINRALEVSLKDDDKNKTISIGLKDIDSAILFYLENVIKPTITQNDRRLSVPIIYGSPERWKSMQADGFYRDKNGKTMVPLVMFKRDSFTKNNLGISFGDGNKVNNLKYYGLEEGKIISYVDRTTPTRGRELTILQQLFGNLGRLGAGSLPGN